MRRIHQVLSKVVGTFLLGASAWSWAASDDAPGDQTYYTSPEAAVEALVVGVKAGGGTRLEPVFGRDGVAVLANPDQASAAETRQKFLQAYAVYHHVDELEGRQVLSVGAEAWPFPIPLVKEDKGWRFAVEEGIDEILNRRIGANEHQAIAVLEAFPEAQHQYASQDRNGDGVLEYAGRMLSSAGTRDGLYWPANQSVDEEPSPFGPLVAEAGEYLKVRSPGQPYHGYRFRILTRQGKEAAGGAYDYAINGRLLAGVALLAWPETYGQTGVMTLMVNQNGVLFQRDLGVGTAEAVVKITSFNPDEAWSVVEE